MAQEFHRNRFNFTEKTQKQENFPTFQAGPKPTPAASSPGFAPGKGKQWSPILAQRSPHISDEEHYDKHFPVANQGWRSDMGLDDEWVLDTGSPSPYHLTSRRDLLQDLQHIQPISVCSADGLMHMITATGLVQSERFSLPNVHYLKPEIRKNIVSASRLSDYGLDISFNSRGCVIRDPATGLEVGRGRFEEKSGHFVLEYLHVPLEKDGPSAQKEARRISIEWARRVTYYSGILGSIAGAIIGHGPTATALASLTGICPMVVDRLTRLTTARDNATATGSASSVERDNREWVLDAFAFKHHTSNPRLLLLQDQETAAAAELETREGGVLRTLGTGSVKTELFNVPGVRYVEGDERNVISVGQLAADHGLVTVFDPPSCYVKDKKTGKIIGKGHLRSGTFVLDYLRIGQDRGRGNEEQRAKGGGDEGSGGSGGPTQSGIGGQGGNQDKGGGDERGGGGGGGGGDGDDQASGGGDDQTGCGDDNIGSQHRGQSGGGDDERGGGGGGGGGGGDNGGRDRGGSGGRDGERGGMEGDKEKDDDDDDEEEEEAEVKDSSQAGTYLFRLSQLGKYITAALSYVFSSLLGEGGGGVEEKEKKKEEGGGGGTGEGKKGGEEQELEESESSKVVRAAMFGLLRPEPFQPRFPCVIYPTSANEGRSDEYLLDTGASFHVTWNKDDLHEYRQDVYFYIKPPIWGIDGIYKPSDGTSGTVDVTGYGYLDGDIKVDGVLLAPNVQMNLISFGQLHCQYGVKLEMDTSFVLTRPDGVEVGGGYMKPENHHYVLQYFQPGRLFANEVTFNRNIFGKDFFSPQQVSAEPNNTNLQRNEDLPQQVSAEPNDTNLQRNEDHPQQVSAEPNDTNLQRNEDPPSPDYMIIG